MKIKGIHHINIRPSHDDYDKMIKFYVDDLGFKIVCSWLKDRNGFNSRNCFIDVGNAIIEACETENGTKNSGIIQHFSFEVDDCDEVMTTLKDKGYEVVNSKGLPSDSLYVDVEFGEPTKKCRCGFVLSPSGELIEFYQGL